MTASLDPARGEDTRAVSTVLDVALCLLLVSAAVGVLGVFLAGEDDPAVDPETPDHAVSLLGSTTISVEYDFDSLIEREPDAFDDPAQYPADERTRITHGPTAALLADATLSNTTADEGRLTHSGGDFETALEGPLIDELEPIDEQVAITTHWTPYEGAPLEAQTMVGPTPPPTADVSSVTMTVPSGMTTDPETAHGQAASSPTSEAPHTSTATTAASTSTPTTYDEVATLVATTIVTTHFEPTETEIALERGGLDRDRTLYQYTQFVATVDGIDERDLEEPLAQPTSDAERANEKLIEAMATDLESDLRDAFESPEDAKKALEMDEVTITVQVWNR